jgi:hypothetical protein
MKLGVFAVVLTAGIAQVAAQPIRLVIVSSSIQESPAERLSFGHEQPPAVAKLMKGPGYKTMIEGARRPRPCGGHARLGPIREKGIEISNAFRQALGWPLIEVPNKTVDIKMIHPGATRPPPSQGGPHHPPPPQHHGHKHHHKHHGKHGQGFVTRLHYSIMNLGTWEGRAVAFVLGCGIGVLLRMFWVLAIVTYRAVKGQREEEHEYCPVVTIEGSATPLPPYTYPADEKVELTIKAPAEESK